MGIIIKTKGKRIMKKKIILLLITLFMLSLVACGGEQKVTEEPSDTSVSDVTEEDTKDVSEKYSIGDSVETISAKLVLNNAKFAIALNNVNDEHYLEPKEYTDSDHNNPFVANDGAVLVYYDIELSAIGRSTLDIDCEDIASANYEGKTYEAQYGTCRISTGSSNVLIQSGDKRRIKGYFEIPVNAELNSDFEITFYLPNGTDEINEFTYVVDGDFDYAAVNEKPMEVKKALDVAYYEMEFVYKYAGNVNSDGSMAFSDDRITSIETCLSNLDEEYIKENLPVVMENLSIIKDNMAQVKTLLIDMGERNSDSNLNEMKSLAINTMSIISEVISEELSNF